MKNKQIFELFDRIDEDLIEEAEETPAPKSGKPKALRAALIAAAVAAAVAVLAVVLTLTVFNKKEPERQTPILPAASETESGGKTEKQTAEPTDKIKTTEPEKKTAGEPTETAEPTPTPTETAEPTPTPTVKPKELAPLADSDQFDYQYRNGGYLSGKHIDGFIMLPFGLFRDYAILKVTKIYNDLNEDEEFKLEQRFGIRPYFTYSERYMELFGEEKRENCTQIDYEVIFATHGVPGGRSRGSEEQRNEPLSQMLSNHLPVFIPNSFANTIAEGDTILCELRFSTNYTNNPFGDCLIAAGHNDLGNGYLPGESVSDNEYFDFGVLFKAETDDGVYSTAEKYNDPAYVWWKYSLGSNPLFVIRDLVESIESKIQNGVEFKDKALFAAIPHFASEDHITAEELNEAYTWLYYVWYSPDCITAFDLNKELMDYLGFSLPNDF